MASKNLKRYYSFTHHMGRTGEKPYYYLGQTMRYITFRHVYPEYNLKVRVILTDKS